MNGYSRIQYVKSSGGKQFLRIFYFHIEKSMGIKVIHRTAWIQTFLCNCVYNSRYPEI